MALPRAATLTESVGATLRQKMVALVDPIASVIDRILVDVVERGADPTGGNNVSTIMNDTYTSIHNAGGGILWIPKGTFKYTSDLNWNSNLVSVLGPGSPAVTLQASGTAKIVARPSPFTITQGPKFGGFTVKGDATAPAGAVGVHSGDITGSEWNDVVIKNFSGPGSIGFHLQNNLSVGWTERNLFNRFWVDSNAIGIKCSMSAAAVTAAMNSFGYNRWNDLRMNVGSGQVGFQASQDSLIYNNVFTAVVCNLHGTNPVMFDMLDTSSISGWMVCQAEQTDGTGGIGVREASPKFQFVPNGFRNYTGTMPEDQGGGGDDYTLTGTFRIREGVANARMGAVTLVGGQATVNTTAVKASGQRIILSRQAGNGTRGHLEVQARTAGTSFKIWSLDPAGALVADTSVVSWLIVESY